MYAKKQVDKLIIDSEPENTWIFTWYFQDEFVWSEKRMYSSLDEKPDVENIEVKWQ
jgi:hypothetical protein